MKSMGTLWIYTKRDGVIFTVTKFT